MTNRVNVSLITKGLILESGRERPPDQREVARRVEFWYTFKEF